MAYFWIWENKNMTYNQEHIREWIELVNISAIRHVVKLLTGYPIIDTFTAPEQAKLTELWQCMQSIYGEGEPRHIALPFSSTLCPECGEMIEHEGGCKTCRFCGWSKCG